MPFFLYQRDGDDYVRLRKVPLAGLDGPICAAARRSPGSPEWELSEDGLIRSYEADPNHHAVIIDLKPNDASVSLYRLKYIWGFDDHTWTPLALEFEGLYVDAPPADGRPVDAFKQRFPVPTATSWPIYEFLYVRAGSESGTWVFGTVGSVNAALLWNDTFDSFLKRINRKRRDVDHLPLLGCPD
jgi:hypothetical protein